VKPTADMPRPGPSKSKAEKKKNGQESQG